MKILQIAILLALFLVPAPMAIAVDSAAQGPAPVAEETPPDFSCGCMVSIDTECAEAAKAKWVAARAAARAKAAASKAAAETEFAETMMLIYNLDMLPGESASDFLDRVTAAVVLAEKTRTESYAKADTILATDLAATDSTYLTDMWACCKEVGCDD